MHGGNGAVMPRGNALEAADEAKLHLNCRLHRLNCTWALHAAI
jgi:hypothetical protein